MSVIDVYVGKVRYQIDCAEGEEGKVRRLAEKINHRMDKISKSIGNVDDRTALMFSSLMAEEELESVKNANPHIDELDDNLEEVKFEPNEAEVNNLLASNMLNMIGQIERLATKIQSY